MLFENKNLDSEPMYVDPSRPITWHRSDGGAFELHPSVRVINYVDSYRDAQESFSSLSSDDREGYAVEQQRILNYYRDERARALEAYAEASLGLMQSWLDNQARKAKLPDRIPYPILCLVPKQTIDRFDLQRLWPVYLAQAKAQRRDAVSQFYSFEYSIFKAKAEQDHPNWSRRTFLRKWRKYRRKLLERVRATPLNLQEWRKVQDKYKLEKQQRFAAITQNAHLIKTYKTEVAAWKAESRKLIDLNNRIKAAVSESLKARQRQLRSAKEDLLREIAEHRREELQALRSSRDSRAFSAYNPFAHTVYEREVTKPGDLILQVPIFSITKEVEPDNLYETEMSGYVTVNIPYIHLPYDQAPFIGKFEPGYYARRDSSANPGNYLRLARRLVSPNSLKGYNALQSVLELKDLPSTVIDLLHFIKWVVNLRRGKIPRATNLRGLAVLLKEHATWTIGKACKAYLWYMFGVEPTVNDVRTCMENWSGWTSDPVGEFLVRTDNLHLTIDVKKTVRSTETPMPRFVSGGEGDLSFEGVAYRKQGSRFVPAFVIDHSEQSLSSMTNALNYTIRNLWTQNLPSAARIGWHTDLINRKVFCSVSPNFDVDSIRSRINAIWFDCPILSTAWELTPMSFLVDWFLDVGGLLKAIEQPFAMLYGINEGLADPWYRTVYESTYTGYNLKSFKILSLTPAHEKVLVRHYIWSQPGAFHLQATTSTFRATYERHVSTVTDAHIHDVCRDSIDTWLNVWSDMVKQGIRDTLRVKPVECFGSWVKLSLALSILFGD